MAGNPLPEGMTEEDYEAIYAAVVETVRGRWFLDEFARRARMGEMEQVLSAIGRLESTVLAQRPLPAPETAPHARLFAQRADEIASRLAQIAEDLRLRGADERLCEDLVAQTRALAGLPKIGAGEASSLAMAEPVVAPLVVLPPLAVAAPAVLQIEARPVEEQLAEVQPIEMQPVEEEPVELELVEEEAEAESALVEAEAVEQHFEAASEEFSEDEFSDDEISALSAEPEALFDEEGVPDEWEEEAQPEDLLLAGPSFEQAEQVASLPEEEPEAIAVGAIEPAAPVEAFAEQVDVEEGDAEHVGVEHVNVEEVPAAFVALGAALETELADLEAEDLPAEDLASADLSAPDLPISDLPVEPRFAALAALDKLPLREKLALFG